MIDFYINYFNKTSSTLIIILYNYIKNRCKNEDFLKAIKSTPEFYKQLASKISSICERSENVALQGKGIDVLYRKLMENDYKTAHDSVENKNISVQEFKRSGKSGIYNFDTLDWYESEGVKYEPKLLYSKSSQRYL